MPGTRNILFFNSSSYSERREVIAQLLNKRKGPEEIANTSYSVPGIEYEVLAIIMLLT